MSWSGAYPRPQTLRKVGSGIIQPTEEDFSDLFVFGYSARIFKPEEVRGHEAIGRGDHLISWNGDDSVKIDRYDCRLHLTELSIHEAAASSTGGILKKNLQNRLLSEEERVEEELCDEERYHDLKAALDEAEIEEELKRSQGKGAEFQFKYDNSPSSEKKEDEGGKDNEEEYEDEPYVPRAELKIPTGMDIPETVRMNAIIEKTADFVAKHGPQMEIIIKAKQKNSNRLDFMNWDDKLNTYYRHVLKMIKERGYVPEPVEERLKKKEPEPESDEDSDEDGDYLHPLLTSGLGNKNKPSENNSPRETGTPTLQQVSYKLGEENDVYSALFHKLSALMPKKEEPLPAVEAVYSEFENAAAAETDPLAAAEEYESHGPPPSDYSDWYQWFYGVAPAVSQQGQVIPPPPDMMPVINKSAEFVYRFGPSAEAHLRQRRDLQLDFLQVGHQYHAYYETKIRWLQYEAYVEASKAAMAQESAAAEQAEQKEEFENAETPPLEGDVASGNRAARRRQMFSSVPPPPDQPDNGDPNDKARLGPISFQIKKEEASKIPHLGVDETPIEGEELGEGDGSSPSTSVSANGEPVKRRRRGFARIGSAPVFGSNEPGSAIPPPGLVKIEGQPAGGKEKIQILPLPSTIVGQVLPEEPTPALFRVRSPSPRSSSKEPSIGAKLSRRDRSKSPKSSRRKSKRKKSEKWKGDRKSPDLLPSTAVDEDSDGTVDSTPADDLAQHITKSLELIDDQPTTSAAPAETEEAKALRDARRKRAQMFLSKIKGTVKTEPEAAELTSNNVQHTGQNGTQSTHETVHTSNQDIPNQESAVSEAVEEGEIAEATEDPSPAAEELEQGGETMEKEKSIGKDGEKRNGEESGEESDSRGKTTDLPSSYARTRKARSSRSRSRERSRRHKDSDRKRRKHRRSRSRSSERKRSSKKNRRRSRSRS